LTKVGRAHHFTSMQVYKLVFLFSCDKLLAKPRKKGDQMIYKESDVNKLAIPVVVDDRKLYTLFALPEREASGKSGRKLLVPFDKRFPLVEGFEFNYMYLVEIKEFGSEPGHHYHHQKHELMMVVSGSARFLFKDIEADEIRSATLDGRKNRIIHVKPRIAHAVVPLIIPTIILVMASSPNTEDDEFSHTIS